LTPDGYEDAGKKTLRMKFQMMMALSGRTGARVGSTVLMMGLMAGLMATGAGRAEAQAVPTGSGKLGPAAPVTYENKWELYGGPNFMNFQAGQALPKRANLGGAEASITYWLNKKVGLVGDYRFEGGTTPVLANPYVNRPGLLLNIGMFGVQYRGPKNQYVAINYHAYGGVAYGIFNLSTTNIPPTVNIQRTVGLYPNGSAGLEALGGSIDFNRSKNLAFRLSPDLILEQFGTGTSEFFAISGGVVYRFGNPKKK
jgi:hypothetical protein